MKISIPADIKVEFEHRIRSAWLHVEAQAWSDDDGIYKTEVTGVYLDGAEVSGLLTDADILDIECAIEPAIHADASDRACSAFIPERDAHRMGD